MMPVDKLAHACLGALIAGGALVVAGPLWAFTAVLLAAVSKELYDTRTHGRPDVWDAVATLAGSGIVLGAAWALG